MNWCNILILAVMLQHACHQEEKVKIPFSNNEKYLGVTKWQNTIQPPAYKRKANSYLIDSNAHYVFVASKEHKRALSTELSYFERFDSSKTKNGKRTVHIELKIVKDALSVEDWVLESYQKEQFYQIDFTRDLITIKAFGLRGLSIGLSSLYYELQYGSGSVPAVIKDWPDIQHRILQIELKAMDPEIIIHNLERAWIAHFNGLLFCMHNSVRFNAIDKYVEKWAMEKSDFKQIVDFARSLKFDVVPQFSFLSHQKKELIDIELSPELMHNELTLNPANDEVYKIIFSLIDEVDSLIKPKAIHISHDEVLGYLEKHRKKYGPQLPAHLFLKNVKILHDYLSRKDIETWMWGDMLLNPETFPDMHSSSLNATQEYEKLILDIPDDVVICDWHYLHTKWRYLKPLTFPSIKYFQSHGHKVIGATFKEEKVIRQYSKKLYHQLPNEQTAMIATVWHELLNGSIKNTEKSDSLKSFDHIVQQSANSFWTIND